MLTFAVCSAIVILLGADIVTGISATAAALGNVGPGFNQVGPMANFADLHPVSRFVLTLAMWIGRLEVITVLVILRPEAWRSSTVVCQGEPALPSADTTCAVASRHSLTPRAAPPSDRRGWRAARADTRLPPRRARTSSATATKVAGSRGSMPNSIDCRYRAPASAPTSPTPMPIVASATPRRITSAITWPAFGAERHADANLLRALHHGVGEHAVDADRRQHCRHRRQRCRAGPRRTSAARSSSRPSAPSDEWRRCVALRSVARTISRTRGMSAARIAVGTHAERHEAERDLFEALFRRAHPLMHRHHLPVVHEDFRIRRRGDAVLPHVFDDADDLAPARSILPGRHTIVVPTGFASPKYLRTTLRFTTAATGAVASSRPSR